MEDACLNDSGIKEVGATELDRSSNLAYLVGAAAMLIGRILSNEPAFMVNPTDFLNE